jgi:hypothetical protein
MTSAIPSVSTEVHGQAWSLEDCRTLRLLFEASTKGHGPIRAYGADRVRYDLPVGRLLQGKLRQAFPDMRGVGSVAHVYRTMTTAPSSMSPHTCGALTIVVPPAGSTFEDASPRTASVEGARMVTSTCKVVVFLSTTTGSRFYFGGIGVQPVEGTAVRFAHGVSLSCEALGTEDKELTYLMLHAW